MYAHNMRIYTRNVIRVVAYCVDVVSQAAKDGTDGTDSTSCQQRVLVTRSVAIVHVAFFITDGMIQNHNMETTAHEQKRALSNRGSCSKTQWNLPPGSRTGLCGSCQVVTTPWYFSRTWPWNESWAFVALLDRVRGLLHDEKDSLARSTIAHHVFEIA
mmetsp:Transcript_27201/g.63176  ORF Transcript_27201/g.63176 Transcript_27201/m.63176 type:complete len:158 (+) Transcript_27201:1278-1751(+)